MAFPQVAAKGTIYNTGGSVATSHAVPYPTGITSGQLLLCIAGIDGVTGTPAITGFTALVNTTGSSERLWIAYKVATGSETGNATLTTASEQVTARIWRITGWHGTTTPEATAATGSSANGNPPSETASWGTADNLWITAVAVNGGPGTTSVYSLPDNQENASTGGSGAAGHAACSDELAQATLDPGTFTHTSQTWVAATVVIRPAAAGGTQHAIDGKGAVSTEAEASVNLALPVAGKGAVSTEAEASVNLALPVAARADTTTEAEASIQLALPLIARADASTDVDALLGLLVALEGKG